MASDSLAMPRHQSVTGANGNHKGNGNEPARAPPAPAHQLLNAMAKGEVDTQAIAARLMAERGLDRDGKWVGFEKAKEVWRVCT